MHSVSQNQEPKSRRFLMLDISYIPLIVGALVTCVIIYLIYQQTQEILKIRLQQRLTAITATAVLPIRPESLEKVIALEASNPDAALQSIELKELVSHLKKVRDANDNIRFIYMWHRKDDSNMVYFTADAEMIDPIDEDGNGLIEDEEIPPSPGEEYDASEIPNILDGFKAPTAQKDFIIDKWGTFMSAFAPVKNSKGETVAILGIDVEVSDFKQIISATLIPFSILAAILLGMLTIQTVALVRIWRSRVDVVKDLDRQKDELLSIVSHQLATPVSSMSWYLEMMLDGDFGTLSPKLSENVKSLQSTATNLSDLVHMILDVSRFQLGKMKVDRTDLNLNEFFAEILNMIQAKVLERKVKLTVHIPKDLPVACLDKRLMRMTFENLLSNAVKYSKDVGGEVELNIEVKNDKLSYSVKDNGRGIPKEEQSKIFGKLFRASNVQQVDGNGFGLFAAKGAVEAQGGQIGFVSQVDNGTTFSVSIPLK